MSRTPENFEARPLRAKEVTSKGGNRGFDHRHVPVPSELEQRIAAEVAVLNRRLGSDLVEAVEEGAGAEVEESEREGNDNDIEAIEADVEREVDQTVIEAEIEAKIDQAQKEQVETEVKEAADQAAEEAIRDALQRSIIESRIADVLDQT